MYVAMICSIYTLFDLHFSPVARSLRRELPAATVAILFGWTACWPAALWNADAGLLIE